jgi:hypothetical protein
MFPDPTGDKKELRYYVLKGQTNPELALLESSVTGVPMPGPPGKRARSFKVPPPGVCNSILVRAAEVRGLWVDPAGQAVVCETQQQQQQQQHGWGSRVLVCRPHRCRCPCWRQVPKSLFSCPAAES